MLHTMLHTRMNYPAIYPAWKLKLKRVYAYLEESDRNVKMAIHIFVAAIAVIAGAAVRGVDSSDMNA